MTKFSKRMRKSNRKARNVLVIGTAFGNVEEMLDTFDTVFVINCNLPRIQKRNIVYREDFDNIHLITDIDLIIIDIDQQHTIPEIIQVWRRTNPTIVIQGPELITKEYNRILKSDHYEIKEVSKGYYVWKNKL